MNAKRIVFLCFTLICSACAIVRSPSVNKIALLAPFEGRYREIGYNALYAARLAIEDSGIKDFSLLAVDDGGSEASAIARIKALNTDPDVKFIITLGAFSTLETVQHASEKPLIIVGSWGASPASEQVFILANADIEREITLTQSRSITSADVSQPLIVSELFALSQIPDLYDDLSELTILSSGSLPSEDFRDAFIASDLYVPEPNLLATLSYDAMGMIIQSITSNTSIADITYEGINGTIHFENGYWKNAPIYHYHYEKDKLQLREAN